MKTIRRRDRLRIYRDLLAALYSRSGAEKMVLTQIQAKINVPYDRLKTYITELEDLCLITDETSLKLTKKGIHYLREYERILDFMKRMGIRYQ